MTKGDVKKEKDKFNDNNKDYIINEINKESTNISQQQNLIVILVTLTINTLKLIYQIIICFKKNMRGLIYILLKI